MSRRWIALCALFPGLRSPDRILVLTVRSVPAERALPWARQLAQTAIQRDS
jgi:hypothetical protein